MSSITVPQYDAEEAGEGTTAASSPDTIPERLARDPAVPLRTEAAEGDEADPVAQDTQPEAVANHAVSAPGWRNADSSPVVPVVGSKHDGPSPQNGVA